MGYPYNVGEHDIPPGVTVCYVKDTRTGEIVRDGLHIDAAEAVAERMNEEERDEDDAYQADEDEPMTVGLDCCPHMVPYGRDCDECDEDDADAAMGLTPNASLSSGHAQAVEEGAGSFCPSARSDS